MSRTSLLNRGVPRLSLSFTRSKGLQCFGELFFLFVDVTFSKHGIFWPRVTKEQGAQFILWNALPLTLWEPSVFGVLFFFCWRLCCSFALCCCLWNGLWWFFLFRIQPPHPSFDGHPGGLYLASQESLPKSQTDSNLSNCPLLLLLFYCSSYSI